MEDYRVLIVDDEAMQRELICEVLKTAPDRFQVLEARNGEEALQILRRETVDAVLLDKRMPILDGDSVVRRIRNELGLKLLPIIMVTGTNSSEDLALSLSSGANDFIRKPYSPIELLARLKSAVSNKRLTDQLDSAEHLLFALARLVEAKDETTGDHCSRLSHMAQVFGRTLGLPEVDVEALRRGGILHDIGKLGIPDSILLKQGPLNEEEWMLMRSHTVIGGHLCEGLPSMRAVRPIILHHHERWDGSGYPNGLAGEDIPLLARIFQIIDIYDALASARPYKPALPREEIIAIFEEETERGWRDPVLVQRFLDILRTTPECLVRPITAELSMDERIFNAISATGVVDWDKNNRKGGAA